ncbi:MAG: cysteine desulfurase family protein [Patescibacteria group bacterium]
MPRKNIYLDYAATTPVDPVVLRAMAPYWSDKFGNPSSLYSLGLMAKQAVENARTDLAQILNCQAEEIIFTSGGTESIALAIKGLTYNFLTEKNKPHLIISAIEHHAVLHTAEHLAKQGFTVSIVPVDDDGIIMEPLLNRAIRPNTMLVSIMTANNEIGTLQPIQKIGANLTRVNMARQKSGLNKIYFHTDACQAAGALPLDVQKMHVDLLTINGSKIYGPKGVGLLYARRGTPLAPLIDGGGQEKNLRSGTENVPGIIGLAAALKLAQKNREKENRRLIILRDWLIKSILKKIPKTILNGHAEKRLPNNINISILDIEGEALLLYLDEVGVQASTGSACTSTTLEPSHVIRALGRPYEAAHGSLRFTLGKYTTKKDLEYLMTKLPDIVDYLRKGSPVRVDMASLEKSIRLAPKKIINLPC